MNEREQLTSRREIVANCDTTLGAPIMEGKLVYTIEHAVSLLSRWQEFYSSGKTDAFKLNYDTNCFMEKYSEGEDEQAAQASVET